MLQNWSLDGWCWHLNASGISTWWIDSEFQEASPVSQVNVPGILSIKTIATSEVIASTITIPSWSFHRCYPPSLLTPRPPSNEWMSSAAGIFRILAAPLRAILQAIMNIVPVVGSAVPKADQPNSSTGKPIFADRIQADVEVGWDARILPAWCRYATSCTMWARL